MLEWILDREGHEFLIPVDRAYIKDKFNLTGLKEKFINELNAKDDALVVIAPSTNPFQKKIVTS